MKKPKLVVPYEHQPEDLRMVYLAQGDDEPKDWTPALRDTINDRRVVWIRSDSDEQVWLRDSQGVRKVRAIRV